ncbi:MAG: hypothetical protein O7F71_05750, partial [Gammaproteobacteria bacterium]|nr:hypothetical protein [Gammaproteobacteria bacterium]
ILTQDIMGSFGVFIMIVSAGIFLTTTPWILASVVTLSVSWIVVLWTNEFAMSIPSEGLLWVTSVIFCFFFYYLRVKSARRLGEYQLRQDAYRVQLEEAAQEIETLSGLLHICAKCKNIKDDNGRWHQIEDYVGKHSQAEFTHSVYPSCFEEIYPGYDYDDKPPQ